MTYPYILVCFWLLGHPLRFPLGIPGLLGGPGGVEKEPRRRLGTGLEWDHGTMGPWDHGTMGPWDHGTIDIGDLRRPEAFPAFPPFFPEGKHLEWQSVASFWGFFPSFWRLSFFCWLNLFTKKLLNNHGYSPIWLNFVWKVLESWSVGWFTEPKMTSSFPRGGGACHQREERVVQCPGSWIIQVSNSWWSHYGEVYYGLIWFNMVL